MDNRPEDRQKIEAYLRGNLSPEEKQDFEARIASDSELAEEVRHQAGQQELFRAGRRMQMMQQLQEVEASIQSGRKRNRRLLALAATLLLLFLAARFFFQTPPSNEDLYKEHFELYLLGGPQRDNAPPTPYDKAWEAYQNSDFQAALAYFDTVSTSHPDYPSIQLYRAVSNMGQGLHERAITQLQTITNTEGHPFVEEALYYLGLSQLRLEHTEEAAASFEKFQQLNGQYHKEDVEEILQKIN